MKKTIITTALAGMMSSGCSMHSLYADPSQFTLTSTPPGATVYVMGQAVGITPLDIQRKQVFPGNYPSQLQAEYGMITLEHPGCEPYRKAVNNTILERGLNATLKCQTKTTPAAISVTPKQTSKERLLELKSLYEEGLITEQEYKTQRQSILNDI